MPSRGLGIRLALHGCVNRPFFHIVVIRRFKGRDAPPIEQIGSFDPMPNKHGEKLCAVNFERLDYWLGRKATPSRPVQRLLGFAGYLPIHPRIYDTAKKNRAKLDNLKSETDKQEDST